MSHRRARLSGHERRSTHREIPTSNDVRLPAPADGATPATNRPGRHRDQQRRREHRHGQSIHGHQPHFGSRLGGDLPVERTRPFAFFTNLILRLRRHRHPPTMDVVNTGRERRRRRSQRPEGESREYRRFEGSSTQSALLSIYGPRGFVASGAASNFHGPTSSASPSDSSQNSPSSTRAVRGVRRSSDNVMGTVDFALLHAPSPPRSAGLTSPPGLRGTSPDLSDSLVAPPPPYLLQHQHADRESQGSVASRDRPGSSSGDRASRQSSRSNLSGIAGMIEFTHATDSWLFHGPSRQINTLRNAFLTAVREELGDGSATLRVRVGRDLDIHNVDP